MCRRRRATNTLLRLFSIDSCLFVLQHETIDIYYLRRLVEIESESIKKTMKHSFNHGSTQYFSTISVRCEFLYLTSTRLLYIKINKFTRRCTSVKTNVVFGYKYLNICFKVLFFRSELKHTMYIHVCRNIHTHAYIYVYSAEFIQLRHSCYFWQKEQVRNTFASVHWFAFEFWNCFEIHVHKRYEADPGDNRTNFFIGKDTPLALLFCCGPSMVT